MGSPSPVPPCFAEVDLSACSYSLKTLLSPSSDIPSPVSVTANLIISMPSSTKVSTSRVTVPFEVNLKPLLRKFVRHCLILVSSCVMEPSASCRLTLNPLSFEAASGPVTSFIVSTMPSISKLVRYSSILPASILEMSKILLIRDKRWLPAEVIFFRSGSKSS